MSYGVSHRRGLDPEWLWLWPAPIAPDSTPSLGTSICHICSPKKQKSKKKKTKKKKQKKKVVELQSETIFVLFQSQHFKAQRQYALINFHVPIRP